MIVKCPELGYLEDTPVFDNDRRVAEAYFRGDDKATSLKEMDKERK